MTRNNAMSKQTYRPGAPGAHRAEPISIPGLNNPVGIVSQRGKDWIREQACRHETFSMVTYEGHLASCDDVTYTRMDTYVKINFWLSGRHTTVLDGFGEHEHDRPEVFITACPQEMLKTDIVRRGSPFSVVALCLLGDFFPRHLGMELDELPDPLRGIVRPSTPEYAFCRFPLTTDLADATRAILSAPLDVRSNARYGEAKCVELMCLLINLMVTQHKTSPGRIKRQGRQEACVHKARELISQRFAEDLTIDQISREVGLNKVSLTSGFRELFKMSVHDFLQKKRMEKAYQMLVQDERPIAQVAQAVGFSYPCNFSTAFQRYFGHSPTKIRRDRN